MSLIAIAPPQRPVLLDIRYATDDNITGAPVYKRAAAYLHADAARLLDQAIALAARLGYRLKIFDAFRPTEAQWALWNHTPDPNYFADPRRGSPHSRGVAVDLTLVDQAGQELDMGTGFDALTPLSHHGCLDIPATAQLHRAILLGIMTAAGWDFYRNEWWHYQMFDARRYPLLADSDAGSAMM